MPLITRGPAVPAVAVGSSATAGLLRYDIHLSASQRLGVAAGTPVALFGSLMASPLSQRTAAAPAPQPNQRVLLRATWYVPGEGETGDQLAECETDQGGLFGFAVIARDVPVDYRVIVPGPEGQPPLATSDSVRVSPH
jgi:hypothetical protein